MQGARRNLVMVRAGDDSLHRTWLDGAGDNRSWDLVVSWYGDGPYQTVADELVLSRKGGKFDVYQEHLTAFPELLDGYDLIWFADDDLVADAARIELLSAEMQRFELSIGQPSLTAESYFSHLYTLNSPSFRLRYAGAVECMAPCMTQALVRELLPYFAESPTGWGFDWIWTRLAEDNRYRAAVIDSVAIVHTRPVGRFLMGRMKAQGLDPRRLGQALLTRFGWQRRRDFPCYGGVTRSGRRLGHGATALLMAWDCLRGHRRWVEPKAWQQVKRTFRFAYRAPDLGQLSKPVPRGSGGA